MARGAWSKGIVKDKILKMFEGSFENGTELRVPMIENGERVEIKITLTCAKTNVGDAAVASTSGSESAASSGTAPAVAAEPTEEEKKNVNDFLSKLGLA